MLCFIAGAVTRKSTRSKLRACAFVTHHENEFFGKLDGIRYFDTLMRREQWQYFVEYRKVADQMLSEQYLIDQLKWILKRSSIELEYDLYVQAMLDSDFFESDVFKPGKWDKLHEKYAPRFKQAFSTAFEPMERLESSQDEREDTLPF